MCQLNGDRYEAATKPTTPVLGLSGWNADMAARQRRLLRDQDAQLRILRDLVEDMREMNRSALDAFGDFARFK